MKTIHYGDRTEVQAATLEEWRAAPAWNVIAVSWPDEDVVVDFCYGRAFYFEAPWVGEVISADIGGLWDFLRSTPLTDTPLSDIRPSQLIELGVKFGRTIATSDYQAIIHPLMKSRGVHTVKRERLPEQALV